MINWKRIENDVQDILEQPGDLDTKLEKVCRYLKENVEHYDWVGFYFVDPRKKDELVGELDIDSHKKDAFTEEDKYLLENIARMVGDLM